MIFEHVYVVSSAVVSIQIFIASSSMWKPMDLPVI